MKLDWTSIREETTVLLQNLIRFDTTNPPGNERACVQFIADLLKREGIDSVIYESQPLRANLVARLKGNGSLKPLILMGHVDVVPVEPDKWTYPPFGAEIHDGYLYGRGALDMKGPDAIEIMVFILLKRLAVPLARDVILEINADEEMGGKLGAGWMIEHHPELVQAEYGITESGGRPFPLLGKEFYVVQTSEKGTARFTLRTRGVPGHASRPHKDNAILKLAAALQKLGETELPLHVTATMRRFIETVAAHVGADGKKLLGLLEERSFAETLKALAMPSFQKDLIQAQFHNSIGPTILRAGSKINVIPSVAECEIDCRVVPGQRASDVEREVRAVLGDLVEIQFQTDTPGIESNPDSPLFETIVRVVKSHLPSTVVVPYLQVGATDARHNTKLGTKIYGFTPTLAPIEEFSRVHGHDERIRLSDIEFGTRVLFDVVREFCAV
jgi:acetylornithine deacetylase/succinyl-diaminopimelate desuccinylase-like protein